MVGSDRHMNGTNNNTPNQFVLLDLPAVLQEAFQTDSISIGLGSSCFLE